MRVSHANCVRFSHRRGILTRVTCKMCDTIQIPRATGYPYPGRGGLCAAALLRDRSGTTVEQAHLFFWGTSWGSTDTVCSGAEDRQLLEMESGWGCWRRVVGRWVWVWVWWWWGNLISLKLWIMHEKMANIHRVSRVKWSCSLTLAAVPLFVMEN